MCDVRLEQRVSAEVDGERRGGDEGPNGEKAAHRAQDKLNGQ